MSDKVVIIAEDDELLRNLYKRKFTLSGYNTHIATNGAEALQLIEKLDPDLLILDINMPEMNGLQVLDNLPEEKRTFAILLLSNFADESHKKRVEELKVDRYLEKQHTTIKKLLGVVEELLSIKN